MTSKRGKVLRAVGVVLGVLALLVGGGVLYASCQLESIVEAGIERHGSEALGLQIEVGEVGLSLLSGEGELKTVNVGNAPGFEEPYLLSVSLVTVKVDPWSALSRQAPVHVHDVEVEGATITFEAQLLKTNVTWLRDQLDEREPRTEAEAKQSKRKVIVDRFALKSTRVRLVFDGRLRKVEREIRIPDIELRDIGGKAGLTPKGVARHVVMEVAEKVRAQALETEGPWQDVLQNVRSGIDKRIDDLGGAPLRKAGQGLLDAWRQRALDSSSGGDGGRAPSP